MTDDATNDGERASDRLGSLSTVSTYKILGRFAGHDGAAVLGRNDAGSGTPVGVQGAVPNNASGFGLETPDDARVEGEIEATSGHVLTVDGEQVLSLGAGGLDGSGFEAGGNVVGGWNGNDATSTVGATISGGGTISRENTVFDNYGTIGGGRANRAGNLDADPTVATAATVGGGGGNGATGEFATVGGGSTNYAEAKAATVGGGEDNAAGKKWSTVGGGRGNTASGQYVTISGGVSNTVTASKATIGGGDSNTASDDFATVAGGQKNDASQFRSTVGGGYNNDATGVRSVVSGGFFNEASGRESVVGGGSDNEAAGDNSLVGGGNRNTAAASGATIAGGTSNVANGQKATVGGGTTNVAGSGSTTGVAATVPGGRQNGATGDYSLAAGRQAKATEAGAFVWADAVSGSVTSATSNSFVVAASNGVGLGTTDPQAQLHVRDSAIGTGADLSKHAAVVQNTEADSSADVLGLQLSNVNNPGGTNNFITFIDDDAVVGSVEGDGGGGVNYASSTADFAEYFPKADPDYEFEDGEVVGLRDGEVVPLDDEVDAALVVSTAPIVTGNRPVGDEAGYVDLSLVGQVPVRVQAPVEAGDPLVASPDDDGTAVSDRHCEGDRPLVGIALEGTDESGGDSRTHEVLGLVGGPGAGALRDRPSAGEASRDGDAGSRGEDRDKLIADFRTELERKDDRIEELATENDALRDRVADMEAENEVLRERLAAVEAHLDLGETPSTPADE